MRPSRLFLKVGALTTALVFAAAPLTLSFGANPDIVYDSYPCAWAGRSGATGNGVIAHPFSETYGSCYQVMVTSVTFRGSDSNWYWYYGSWQTGGNTSLHFCSNPTSGTGTCWWADRAYGTHQTEVFPAIYSSLQYTHAQCVGC